MIPPVDHPRWREILSGNVSHVFKSVPAGLMISRLRRQLETDGSTANLDKSVREMWAFFEKYEKITTSDLNAIFS